MSGLLIVDDEPQNRYYLEVLLRASQYTVRTAAHGAEALELARQTPPDLVIADLLMPVMDGYTLLRHWRADPQLQHLPFIVYTATYTDAEDERLALDLGADSFLVKPLEPDVLLQHVHKVLRNPARDRPPPVAADTTPGVLLENYNQVLIRKLEERSHALEQARRSLERDVARRQSIESALRQSEERLRLLALATNDAIFDWQIDSDVRWWNEGLQHEFGLAPEQLNHDRAWQAQVHPDDVVRLLDDRSALLAGDGLRWQYRYRLRVGEGQWRWVEERARLIRNAQGQPTRMVGGLADIHQQMVLEEQLQQAQRMEAVGQLTGGLAHDFNNLLTVVLGNAQFLAESLNHHDEWRESASMIEAAAERGTDITRRLLHFARPRQLSAEPHALATAIRHVLPLLQKAVGADIRLECDLADALPPALIDLNPFEQALLNLCLNARDAIHRDGVIRIHTQLVNVPAADGSLPAALERGRYLAVRVSDNGSGISPQHLPRIFDPFYTTKNDGKGSGLGLPMAYSFARQCGGLLTVTTQPGRGSEFTLYLPAAEPFSQSDSAESTAPRQNRTSPESRPLTGAVILLVEDDELVRDFARQHLTQLGCQVLAAANASAALFHLRAETPVDLLFSDIIMPGMNGRELAREALHLRPDLKILLTTGYEDQARLESADLKHTVLPKPYRRDELTAAIGRQLVPAQPAQPVDSPTVAPSYGGSP